MKLLVLVRRFTAPPGAPAAGALLGACEWATVRTAAQLLAATPELEISVLTVGPDREDAMLHRVAPLLHARAVRLWHPALEGADFVAYGLAIAAAARIIGYELILCGERSVDEGLGAVGPATAEYLDILHLTSARAVRLGAGGRIEIVRAEERGTRTLLAPTPLLVSVTPQCAADHPLTVSGLGKSRRGGVAAPIELFDLKRVGLLPEELRHRRQFKGAMRPREAPASEILADARALAAWLRQEGWVTSVPPRR